MASSVPSCPKEQEKKTCLEAVMEQLNQNVKSIMELSCSLKDPEEQEVTSLEQRQEIIKEAEAHEEEESCTKVESEWYRMYKKLAPDNSVQQE